MFRSVILGSLFIASAALAFGPPKPKPIDEFKKFPQGFKWCAATSAHQIEGNNVNSDWWEFEKLPGAVKNGDHSGLACDHWNRLEQDTQLLSELGMGAYRFSIEWAKIEPEQGRFDEAAVEHYRKEIRLLRERGIEPMITLHHFTFPSWVRQKGGWEWSGIEQAFTRYTDFVFTQIAPDVSVWVTINEPMVHLLLGYVLGMVPPTEKRDITGLVKPIKGLLRAHAAAYHRLHTLAFRQGTKVQVGIAHHLRVFDSVSLWSWDTFATESVDRAWNWMPINAVETGKLEIDIPFKLNVSEKIPGLKGTQDFIGINYYSRDFVKFSFKQGFEFSTRPELPKSDVGWEIYPEGIYRLLKQIDRRYGREKPVLILENGLADSRDAMRTQFLESHLTQIHRAIGEGVRVEAYCHWSLMDNFEWIEGYAPRFGLYEVDYSTQERWPRPSALIYSQIAAQNGFRSR